MGSLFCIVALIIIGYLMIVPFFRLRKNQAFRWYCFLIVIYFLLCGLFRLDRIPILASILAFPSVFCLLIGWITERVPHTRD